MSCLLTDDSSSPHSNSSNNNRRIYSVFIFLILKVSYLARSFEEIFFNVGKISDVLEVIQHVRESLERVCRVPLTSRQYVSILNHADLQILEYFLQNFGL